MKKWQRALALVVTVALAAACGSGGGDDVAGTTTTTSPGVPAEPVEVPAQPAPLARDAATVADGFESEDPDQRAAALLAAYEMAGIPVVDDDTIGIPWPFVWATATAPSAGTRMSLAQVATLFAADGNGALDTNAVAAGLVGGLRDALATDTSVAGPGAIALLVKEESLRTKEIDLADPATTADQVYVSMPAASVLVSAGLLATMADAQGAGRSEGSAASTRQAPPGVCADDSVGQWSLWVISKFAAGVELGGITPWNGPFLALIDHLRTNYPKGSTPVNLGALEEGLGKVAGVAGFAAAALTALSLVVAMMTHTADFAMDAPLVRTKSSRENGETKELAVTVKYDYGSFDAERTRALNCVLTLLGVLGNNTTLPPPGPLAEVAVAIQGGAGFADRLITKGSYVLFANTQLQTDTDAKGVARFSVMGRMQPRDVPDGAPAVEKKASVYLEAAADPVNGETIAKTFLDSFLCASPAAAGGGKLGCVDPIVDIAKQFHWDLGEFEFAVTDWGADGFLLDMQAFGLPNPVSGYVFDVVGNVQGCPRSDGRWEFFGAYTVTNHLEGDAISDYDGWFLDMTEGGQSPANPVSLMLAFLPTVEGQKELPGNAADGNGTLVITNALSDAPTAAATIQNTYNEVLGTYDLPVTVLEDDC